MKQRKAAKRIIRKAIAKCAKLGTKGKGEYYRIIVRPKKEFITFRHPDVGRKGHIQRLSGKRRSRLWDTQAWLIKASRMPKLTMKN